MLPRKRMAVIAAQQHRIQARKTIAVQPIVAAAMVAAVEETKSALSNFCPHQKWARPMAYNVLQDADNA